MVVAEPSFPQSVSANTVVGDVGFAVRNDVFDVLARTQFHAAAEELVGGSGGDGEILRGAQDDRGGLRMEDWGRVWRDGAVFPIACAPTQKRAAAD